MFFPLLILFVNALTIPNVCTDYPLSLRSPLLLGCGAPALAAREEALRAPSCRAVCPSGRPLVFAPPRAIMEGAAASAEGLRYAEYARTPTGAGRGQAELDRGLVSAWRDPYPRGCYCPVLTPGFTRVKGDGCERGGGRAAGTGVLRSPPGRAGRLGDRGALARCRGGSCSAGSGCGVPPVRGRERPRFVNARGPREPRKAEVLQLVLLVVYTIGVEMLALTSYVNTRQRVLDKGVG